MAERNIFYERLKWPEIRAAAQHDQVVVIPFASIEQHGPHLPVDVDLRLAREVCVRAARRNPNCLVMTPLAFGFEPDIDIATLRPAVFFPKVIGLAGDFLVQRKFARVRCNGMIGSGGIHVPNVPQGSRLRHRVVPETGYRCFLLRSAAG